MQFLILEPISLLDLPRTNCFVEFVGHHLVFPRVHRRLQWHVHDVYTVGGTVYKLTEEDLVIANFCGNVNGTCLFNSSLTCTLVLQIFKGHVDLFHTTNFCDLLQVVCVWVW